MIQTLLFTNISHRCQLFIITKCCQAIMCIIVLGRIGESIFTHMKFGLIQQWDTEEDVDMNNFSAAILSSPQAVGEITPYAAYTKLWSHVCVRMWTRLVTVCSFLCGCLCVCVCSQLNRSLGCYKILVVTQISKHTLSHKTKNALLLEVNTA